MNQVHIEIYESSANETQCRRLSRKLALLCYFLNTRLDSNLHFVHGGIFGIQFNNTYNGGVNKTKFAVVINKNYIIDNAFYLDDEKLSEEDFRAFSQQFLQTVIGLAPEFKGFSTYKFINCAPIVVGNYYLKESGIDGRKLNFSSTNLGGSVNQSYHNVNLGGSYVNNLGGSITNQSTHNIVQGGSIVNNNFGGSYIQNSANVSSHAQGNVVITNQTVTKETTNMNVQRLSSSSLSGGNVVNVTQTKTSTIL